MRDKKKQEKQRVKMANDDISEEIEQENEVDDKASLLEKQMANADFDNNSNFTVQKKQTNYRKIIIIGGSVVGILLLIGIVLYFIGFFDSKTTQQNDKTSKNIQSKTKQTINEVPQKPKYQFKIKDINKQRINKKLSILTKNEIIEEEIYAPSKVIKEIEVPEKSTEEIINKPTEENKNIPNKDTNNNVVADDVVVDDVVVDEIVKSETIVKKEEKNELKNELKDEKEYTDITQNINNSLENNEKNIEIKSEIKDDTSKEIPKVIEKIVKEDINKNEMEKEQNIVVDENILKESEEKKKKIIVVDENILNEVEKQNNIISTTSEQKDFLKFIHIATIKQNLYLSFLKRLREFDNRISVCRNNLNQIQVFLGPFDYDDDREIILDKIQKNFLNKSFSIDLTQEEFDKRCNF